MKTRKVKEIIKMLEADGWYLKTTRGDHRQFKHPTKKGRVTISGHLSDDITEDNLHSIYKQAGWK